MKTWIYLFLSMISMVNAQCNAQNRRNELVYTCTNIVEIPSSLPPGVTSLYVQDSPDLKRISQLPVGITLLSLNNVGVTDFKSNATSNVSTTLKELHIKAANSLTVLDVGKPSDPSNPSLTELVIMNCTHLSEFDNIAEYKNLESITISSTGIQTIESNMFDGLSSVTYLDISYNLALTYIRENAFEDMYNMQTMKMTGCSLDRLYGDYFNAAYESGSLKWVNAVLNPYQCDKMCDFTKWYWQHSGFYSISLIGTCTKLEYNTMYVYQVFDLTRYGAGCQPIFWIVFGSILGAIVLIGIVMCIFVALCGIDYKEYCCCRFAGSRRNRRNSFSNSNANHTEIDTFYVEGSGLHKSQVPMYADSPPMYDDLTTSAPATTPAIDIDATHVSSST